MSSVYEADLNNSADFEVAVTGGGASLIISDRGYRLILNMDNGSFDQLVQDLIAAQQENDSLRNLGRPCTCPRCLDHQPDCEACREGDPCPELTESNVVVLTTRTTHNETEKAHA